MDVDVQWRGPLRFFAQTLLYLVSREIEQLNVPLSQADLGGGISSQILPLVAPDGSRPYTGWLRRFRDDDAVIHAGFYTHTTPPGAPSPWVAFPMPKGCTTAILRPENLDGDGLRLASWGNRFGEPGTYRLHGSGPRARLASVPVQSASTSGPKRPAPSSAATTTSRCGASSSCSCATRCAAPPARGLVALHPAAPPRSRSPCVLMLVRPRGPAHIGTSQVLR